MLNQAHPSKLTRELLAQRFENTSSRMIEKRDVAYRKIRNASAEYESGRCDTTEVTSKTAHFFEGGKRHALRSIGASELDIPRECRQEGPTQFCRSEGRQSARQRAWRFAILILGVKLREQQHSL
jgi:hypothetical protein